MPDLSMVFDLLARDRASDEVENVGDAMADAGDQADAFGDRVSGMFATIAGAAAGAGLAAGAAFSGALEAESANNLLTAQLGLPPDMAAELGTIAGNLYAANYGESVAETSAAIRATLQAGLLPEDATNGQIESLTGRLFSLADVLETDVGGAANAAGQLVRTGLAASAEEAADLLARATQQGANQFGDLADTIASSSGTLAQYGLSGAEALGLITQTLDNGAPSADFFIGALEEISGNAADSADVFEDLGLNGAAMTEALTNGGPAARDALFSVLGALTDMQDPAARTQALVALFGEEAAALQGALLGLDPATAVAGLGQVAGSATAVDEALAQGIGPTLAGLGRTAEVAASGGVAALIAGFTDGDTTASGWQGTVQNAAATLSTVLEPALSAVGDVLTGTVGPAIGAVAGFLAEHRTAVWIVAAVIGTLMLPALIAWAATSLVSGATAAAAWVGSGLAAVRSSVQQGIAFAMMIAGAVASAASVVVSVGIIVGSYLLLGAQAVLAGARVAATWLVSIVGSAIAGAASTLVSVGIVVGGWVLMGAQALLQAARMAAAWLIAMGPVGWVIAAVIGLVALIIANWDAVKNFTVRAWQAVVEFVTGAWSSLTGAVSSGVSAAVSFVRELPGKLLSAVGNLGSLLVTAGGDLLRGLWNGINNTVGWLRTKIMDWAGNLLPGWVKSILGISSPSKVFADLGRWTMAGFAAGIDDGTGATVTAVQRAMASVSGVGADLSADLGVTGYSSATYDAGSGGGAHGRGGDRTVLVSGVVGPEEVAALVRREQVRDEFLAGAGR